MGILSVFSPAPHTARPFPSRPSMTSLELLEVACPDAHAYTNIILHSSLGVTLEDVIPQRNGFVHTVLECYNEHRALIIRPDDVWIAIVTQFSCFVNGNAEALRPLFVAHDGKKELSMEIRQGSRDFMIQTFVEGMKEQIQQNVIDPEFRQWMIPAFSTTNPTDELVAGMVTMATVKEYFTFRMVLGCGIPRVTLEGQRDDWVNILNRIEKLKEFGLQTTAWERLLHPILSRFVDSFNEPSSAENLEFWNQVAHSEPFGSGSPLLLGWITAFMVFDEKGQWKGDQKSDLVLDGVTYPCLDSDEIPAGYAQVDVTLQIGQGGEEYPTSLIAGSVGTKIFSSGEKTLSDTGERDSARPALGWWWVVKKGTKLSVDTLIPSEKFHWRFIDAHAFVYSGIIRFARFEDIGDVDFVAISYVWTDSIKKWRNFISDNTGGPTYEEKITHGSNMLSTSTAPPDGDAITHAQLFFTIVAFYVLTRGKKFFWIDILCIDQDQQREKEFFVPLMGDLYSGAAETHAYPFGAQLPPSLFSDEVYFPIWETRAWTVQEQILSKRVLFCYALQGDVRQGLRNLGGGDRKSDSERVDLHTPVLDRYQYADGIFLLETKGNIVTCQMETEENSWLNLPSNAFHSQAGASYDGVELSKFLQAHRRGTAQRVFSQVQKSRLSNIAEAARMSMFTIAARKSTIPEDMVYSVLGALQLKHFRPEYKIGFEEARLRVFEALSPKILAHIIGTEWGNGSSANNKDSALPRVDDAASLHCVNSLESAILHCKYTRNIGTQMNCRRERFRVWTADTHVKLNQGFVRTLLGNNRILLMQIASVFDTPEVASMPTGIIPRDLTKVLVVDMSTLGAASDQETSKIDRIVEFVEIGKCIAGALMLPSLPELNYKSSVLALCCEDTESGALLNQGTVLILDASAFSTNYVDTLIE